MDFVNKLDKVLFSEHHANEFPLNEIIRFMDDKDVLYGNWSSSMECEFCNFKALEYFREEETFYNKESGFSMSETAEGDEQLDFAIYRCPQCGKWFTYIE